MDEEDGEMSRIRLVRGTAGRVALCVAALGAIAFTACSSNNSTPPNPNSDGGAEASLPDASMDSGGYDQWNPNDGPSGEAGNEAGDGSSPSDVANDVANDVPNDVPNCITNADCNDGGFGPNATMWCNHHDDNLTYNYPDSGPVDDAGAALCVPKPGTCVPLPDASSCPPAYQQGMCSTFDQYCGCDGVSYPCSPDCAWLAGTNVKYVNQFAAGNCP